MRRKLYEQLLAWKQRSNGQSALLIEGARRVGKSWLAEEFAKNEYEAYLLIDFYEADADIRALFDNYLRNLDTFFAKLLNAYGVKLPPRKSLIIFDEIQLCPRAREAIKALVADGRYDYIETGSLVSLHENTDGILLPSEEDAVTLHPMDFEEYLWAVGETELLDHIQSCYADKQPLGSALHRKAMDYLREYMIIGGMPQAVAEYIQHHDMLMADTIKRRILRLYRNDITNHAKRYALKTRQLFDDIPSQLQEHDRQFHPTALDKDARTRDYDDAIFWLQDAKIINPCFNATEPNIGLKMNMERSVLKCYMGDTGLLISHAFDKKTLKAEEIHRRILCQSIEINQGMFMENLVAQMLVASGHGLYFFSQPRGQTRAEEMEIDFLIAKSKLGQRHNITPIEVKSSKHFTSRSLDKFCTKYKEFINTPIILHSGDLQVKENAIFLPPYMTPLL